MGGTGRHWLRLCIWLGALCCWASGAHAGDAQLTLYPEEPEYTVYSNFTNAHVVHDPNHQWRMEDFVSGERNYRELLQQPHSTITAMGGTYWLVLEVDNRHPRADWRLNFQHGRTDLIEVLALPEAAARTTTRETNRNAQPKVARAGMQSSPQEREIAGLGYTIAVHLPPNETTVLLIRLDSYLYEGGIYIYLEEAAYNLDQRFDYQIFVVALLGLMLGMAVYNLFIFLVTRDITYFWYTWVAGLMALTWASYYGLLWSQFGWSDPYRYITTFSQIGVLIFTLLFVNSFLNIRSISKGFYYAFWACGVYLIAIAVGAFFFHPAYIFLAFWFILLPGTLMMLIVSTVCIIKGYRAARFLIGGQALVAVGTFQTGLAIFGVMPYNDPVPHHFTAMSAGEMVLLSMALADRINQLRDEKRVAEEANRLKSGFLALMSHEIRTPLNGLLSMIKLIARSDLSERQRSYVKALDYSGNALMSMLNSLLDYSKLEARNIELEAIAFDPRSVLESIVILMSARASEKGLILSSKIEKQLPPQVIGDPNRLRQVLLNLIGNGIKFTNRGVVNLYAKEIHRTGTTVTIRFEVEDSGIGIDKEDQAKVFDMFTQADASITRRFGGTGLGLSICRRLVELMGGELALDSEVGVGSNFHFTLQLPYSLEPVIETKADRQAGAITARSLRVLLVDDIELNRVAAAGLLEHEGHKVTLAESARQALEKLQRHSFDIVLMDIHMPDMDGVLATQHIRQFKDPVKAGIPVIALTANANVQQRREYIEAGIDDVVSKPLDVDELLASIARLTVTENKLTANN
ncbi:response regulator [Exilibacterium tricleocarpae]|uniref:histidine kinase n=1 Tax=Exilibacterium tricleocarpae TaxID=2591008 RepID=A0A545SS47_9GAMM|nr:7TM diverse intracellular signaling domain-containing protein [Exilibacterium tricleocarpae]TQV67775.1 response regulator [Exilibacterium tricleocarpae]